MIAIKTIDLSASGQTYIREILSNSLSLGGYLLERHSLETGKVRTFIAADSIINHERVNEPRYGGLHLRSSMDSSHKGVEGQRLPLSNTEAILQQIATEFLGTSERAVFILSDSLARPSDPGMYSLDLPWVAHGQEIYYCYLGSKIPMNLDQAIINSSAAGPPLIGALSIFPIDVSWRLEERKISKEQLELVAQHATTIVVGAYDGEGYLMWTKA